MAEDRRRGEGDLPRAPLPVVGGVGPSCRQLPAGGWATILDFLREQYPQVDTAVWLSRMARGQVVDEGGARLHSASPYRAGARVYYYRELEGEEPIPFVEEILYRDTDLLVVDKPHFLPVIPAGRFLHETLLVRLKKREQSEHLVPLHRLDRETAGVMLFSRNPATRGAYTALFRRREVRKSYEALAPSRPELPLPVTRRSRLETGEPFFRMKETEGEPNSETRVELLERRGPESLYRLIPATGRKHQLRLHLAALGIPILNDHLYPEIRRRERDDFPQPLRLLARSISFRDPLTGQERYFASERVL